MRSFGVVVAEKVFYCMFYSVEVFLQVVSMAEAFFAENAIKSLYVGLFVLLVGSCRSYTGDMFCSVILPLSFKLRSSVSLDVVYLAKVFELLFEGLFSVITGESLSDSDTGFSGIGIYGSKRIDTA